MSAQPLTAIHGPMNPLVRDLYRRVLTVGKDYPGPIIQNFDVRKKFGCSWMLTANMAAVS